MSKLTTLLIGIMPFIRSKKIRNAITKVSVLQAVICSFEALLEFSRMFKQSKIKPLSQKELLYVKYDFNRMTDIVTTDRYGIKHQELDYGCAISLDMDIFIDLRNFVRLMVNNYKIIMVSRPAAFDFDPKVDYLAELHSDIAEGDANIKEYFMVVSMESAEVGPVTVGFEFGGFMSHINMRINFDHDHDVLRNLKVDLQKKLLDRMQGKAIHLSESKKSYEDALAMRTLDIAKPALHSKDKVNMLNSIITNALEIGEKFSVFLYGHPGVSKSTTILASLSETKDVLVFYLDSCVDATKLEHMMSGSDSCKKILIVEEVSNMTKGEYIEEGDENLSQLLHILDTPKVDMIIMTSNTTEVNPALARSGRVDMSKRFDLPHEVERKQTIENLVAQYDGFGVCLTKTNLDYMVKETEGLTHADLHSLFKAAKVNRQLPVDYLSEFKQQKEEFKKFKALKPGDNNDEDKEKQPKKHRKLSDDLCYGEVEASTHVSNSR